MLNLNGLLTLDSGTICFRVYFYFDSASEWYAQYEQLEGRLLSAEETIERHAEIFEKEAQLAQQLLDRHALVADAEAVIADYMQ